MHYKLIILIISSNNLSVYDELRNLGKLYLDLFPDIKYFYLEYKHDVSDVVEDENYLYFSGNESFIPGIYLKSIKAIEYINKNYDYDYILRTNLSSFLNIPNIFKYLDTTPLNSYAGGFMPQGFMSGTGMFMSRDVGNILVNKIDTSFVGDDIIISNVISGNSVTIIDINTYKLGFLTSVNESGLPNNCYFINMGNFNPNIIYPDDILYFRIRNEIDRNIDVLYFKLLLKQIYNINYVELVVEPIIEPIIELSDKPIIEPVVEPVTEPVTELSDKPIIEPVTEPVTELSDKPITELVSEPITEQVVKLNILSVNVSLSKINIIKFLLRKK